MNGEQTATKRIENTEEKASGKPVWMKPMLQKLDVRSARLSPNAGPVDNVVFS